MALELALFPGCSHNIPRHFENQQPNSHNLFGIPQNNPFPLTFQYLTCLEIPFRKPHFQDLTLFDSELFSVREAYSQGTCPKQSVIIV